MEWKEVRLGDVCEIKGGKRLPKGVNLITQKNSHPYIRVRDLGKSKTIELNSSYEYVDEITQKQIQRYITQKGDILISIVGTIGLIAIVGGSLDGANLTENCVKLVKLDKIDSEYLYYYLKSPFGQQNISRGTVGAVQAKLPIKNIQDFSIICPELISDQRRIASILSSLDRKIELNNKINADFEEMAQAIFKNWFVDFEPFKGGKFVDSELGMIPEGWKVGSYSEMIESLIPGDWGKETPQGNYTHEVACVRGCDFQDINNGVRGKTPQRYILEKNYQTKHLKDKDILVEISGGTATVSTGRTSLVTEELLKKYKHDIVCTNFCKVLRPLSQFGSYVYYSWKYKYDNDIMFGYENGTSGIKNFAIKDFIEKEPVLIPKEQDIVEFQKIIDNLQKQKQIKGTENTTLSTLRDTLLPRLMSGEIEVPE